MRKLMIVFALLLVAGWKGGIAPSAPCSWANLGGDARVPYTATYYFYR